MLGSQIKRGTIISNVQISNIIEYAGTDFRGWQVQKKGKQFKGLFKKNIKLLKEKKIYLDREELTLEYMPLNSQLILIAK